MTSKDLQILKSRRIPDYVILINKLFNDLVECKYTKTPNFIFYKNSKDELVFFIRLDTRNFYYDIDVSGIRYGFDLILMEKIHEYIKYRYFKKYKMTINKVFLYN